MKKISHPNIRAAGNRWLCVLIAILIPMLTLSIGLTPADTLYVNAAETEEKKQAFDPFAEDASYSCVLYNNSNGLSTSEANAIAQTSNGFIWIGSYAGLLRYDGNRFERMDSSLGISSVICLKADKKNRLWIGSNDSGLAMLYRDEVVHWGVDEGLISLAVISIVEDQKGVIYVGTKDGIFTVDENRKLHHLTDSRIKNICVEEMTVGSDGSVYCLSQDKTLTILKNRKIEKYYAEESIPELSPTKHTTTIVKQDMNSVRCILPDKSKPGFVYLGTDNGCLFYCDMNGTPKCIKYYADESLNNINSLTYIDNRIWICTYEKIMVFENGKFRVLENIPMNNEIYHVISDFEGNLWFTSSRQGVMKLTPNRFTDIYEEYQLEPAVVNATCLYDDKLFIGTDNGLTVIDEKGVCDSLELKKPVSPFDDKMDVYTDLISVLEGQRIRSLDVDSQDRLWITVWTGLGLMCYDHGSLTIYKENDGLSSNKVRRICKMKDGSIAAATSNGISIIKGDKVVRSYGKDEGLENPMILTLAEGTGGEILAGSDGGGIYVIKGDKVETLKLADGLTSDTILNIKPDHKRDILWIISSNSIGYMSPDHKITIIKNFPYTNNFDFIQNSMDEMWVLSSNGIFVVKTEEMLKNNEINAAHFTASNGLFCTSTPNSGSYVAENGDCYLAGNAGVVKMNIESGFETNSDYMVSVPYIDVNDSRLYPDENGNFTIPSNTKTLTIYGFVFNYSLIKPKVSYSLEGFSDEFVTVNFDELSPVVYTNLSGGEYSFVMKVSDSISDNEKSIKVTIVKEKTFYEQLWFYLLLGAVLILIVSVCVRIIFNRKIKKVQEKHKEEIEKERIQTELNTATQIQADMLPRIFPPYPDRTEFDLFASMAPAKEVGGDFYDFFMIDSDHLAMVIGDVSGKGVPAALFMVISKTLIKDHAVMNYSPKELLSKVNNLLMENNSENMFVSVWFGILEISTGKITATNAGHEYPAIRSAEGKFALMKDKHGPILAAMEDIRYRQYEIQLEKGGCLFVYTDGVPEATNADDVLYGTDRMIEALNREPMAEPKVLLSNITADIDRFVGKAPQFDDLTMLCLQYNGPTDTEKVPDAKE